MAHIVVIYTPISKYYTILHIYSIINGIIILK